MCIVTSLPASMMRLLPRAIPCMSQLAKQRFMPKPVPEARPDDRNYEIGSPLFLFDIFLSAHPSTARSFSSVFSEAVAAKQLFGSVTKVLGFQKENLPQIGEVQIEILGSDLGPIFWTPSVHESLETYLQSLLHIRSIYRTAEMEAAFDFNRQRCKVISAEHLKKFLQIPEKERPPLIVQMPTHGPFTKAMHKIVGQNITDAVSERMRKWCKNRFRDSTVTDDDVDKSLQHLDKAGVDLKTDHSEGHANIMEFVGIKGEKLDEVIQTLLEDSVPGRVISAMKRGKAMRKNSEGVCDFSREDGMLKSLYVLQILTLQKPNNEYDMLIAWFELSLGKPLAIEGAHPGALSISQIDALTSYVETKAANHWKKKAMDLLEADKDGDIE